VDPRLETSKAMRKLINTQNSLILPQISHIFLIYLYHTLKTKFKTISLFYGPINGSIRIPNPMKLKIPFYSCPPPPNISRRQEIALCGLRIGYIAVSHRFLMTKEDSPSVLIVGFHCPFG